MGINGGSKPQISDGDASGSIASQVEPATTTTATPPQPPRELQIGPGIVMWTFLFIIILLAVSVGAPWFLMEQHSAGPQGGNIKSTFGLWVTTTTVDNVTTSTKNSDITCAPLRRRVLGLQALSIISLIVSLATFGICLTQHYFIGGKGEGEESERKRRKTYSTLRIVKIWFVALSWMILTTETALGIDVYTWSFEECGVMSSYHSHLYEVYIGFAFLIVAWVCNLFVGIIAYNNPLFPTDERMIFMGFKLFTSFSVISFIFSVILCFVPLWFYKDGNKKTLIEMDLWKERYSTLWEINSYFNTTRIRDLHCPSLHALFIITDVCAVLSSLMTFITSLCGFCLVKRVLSITQHALVCGFISILISAVQWILLVCIYYGDWCSGAIKYRKHKFVLAAGFALSVSSFTLLTLGTNVLLFVELYRARHYPGLVQCQKAGEILLEMCH